MMSKFIEKIVKAIHTTGTIIAVREDANVPGYYHLLVETKDGKKHFIEPDIITPIDGITISKKGIRMEPRERMPYKKGDEYNIWGGNRHWCVGHL